MTTIRVLLADDHAILRDRLAGAGLTANGEEPVQENPVVKQRGPVARTHRLRAWLREQRTP